MEGHKRTAILCGTAYIGPDLERVDDAVVLVGGGTIEAVGPRGEVAVPGDAAVMDASGQTLLPGFIDAHVHIGLADPRDVLTGGVTCVRDLAWPRDQIYPLAERSRDPGFEGPLILTVGPMLTVEGGYPITAGWAPPGTGLALSSVEEAKSAVGDLARHGVSAIKIALNPPSGRVLDDDLLTAIVDEAHVLGKTVTAHIHGLDQLHRALDAGVDELAHMLMGRQRIPDGTIERMVTAGTIIVPTLSIFPRSEVGTAVEGLARFVSAGGRVVYGTDLGNQGPAPGIDRTEVTRMAGAGMDLLDVVRSATVRSAQWLGLDAKGVIAPGMDADLIGLEGKLGPGDGPGSLTSVSLVMRGGRAIPL